jgi:hypothetical protein
VETWETPYPESNFASDDLQGRPAALYPQSLGSINFSLLRISGQHRLSVPDITQATGPMGLQALEAAFGQ